MRWMAWNVAGCALWLAGLAHAKGLDLVGAAAADGPHAMTGLGIGSVGLMLLMWVNLLDAS